GAAHAGETEAERAIRLLTRARAAGQELPGLTGRADVVAKSASVAGRIGSAVNYFGARSVESRARETLNEMHREWREAHPGPAGRLYRIDIFDSPRGSSDGSFLNPEEEHVTALATGGLEDAVYQAEQGENYVNLYRSNVDQNHTYDGLKAASFVYV